MYPALDNIVTMKTLLLLDLHFVTANNTTTPA